MRTNSRRRAEGLVLAVLTVVLGVPELARAQQTGLFPLAPIKRQRVPCDQEDPIYKTYKYQYFGYHPTCWRRFPDGWGCPSREVGNKEKSYAELPLGGVVAPRADQPPDQGTPNEPGAPTQRPAVPNPPEGGRSPFEVDPIDGTGTAPGRPQGGQARPPVPQGDADPFLTPKPPAGTGQPRTNPPGQTGTPPVTNNDELDLTAPFDQPRRSQGSRSVSRDVDDQPTPGEEGDGPLLALPNLNVPALDPSGSSANGTASNPTSNAPAPRRGLISGFFSNLGWNWTRR
jgi:hypothetical protein